MGVNQFQACLFPSSSQSLNKSLGLRAAGSPGFHSSCLPLSPALLLPPSLPFPLPFPSFLFPSLFPPPLFLEEQ